MNEKIEKFIPEFKIVKNGDFFSYKFDFSNVNENLTLDEIYNYLIKCELNEMTFQESILLKEYLYNKLKNKLKHLIRENKLKTL